MQTEGKLRLECSLPSHPVRAGIRLIRSSTGVAVFVCATILYLICNITSLKKKSLPVYLSNFRSALEAGGGVGNTGT